MNVFRDIRVAQSIQITEHGTQAFVTITKPERNMQTDDACFEAVALILKVKYGYSKITIDFTQNCDWNGEFSELTSDQKHYMRFLYRLWRFTSHYDWACVAEERRALITQFATAFDAAKKITNYPNCDAKFNKAGKGEHKLENDFAPGGLQNNYFNDLFRKEAKTSLTLLDHQFPNGLFKVENSAELRLESQIFPTGFFDLLGVDEKGDLCVFELKKDSGNEKMGLLSELFFYAIFIQDFLVKEQCLGESTQDYRHYQDFKRAFPKAKKIRAFFLVGSGVHTLIWENKEKLMELLNQYDSAISFEFLRYNISEFS